MTWSRDLKKLKMWCSAWQVDLRVSWEHLNCIACHTHLLHARCCNAVEQSESIVHWAAAERSETEKICCDHKEWICSRYYNVSDDMLCIILLTQCMNVRRAFLSPFVRLTTINKSFVVFLRFVLNDPDFYFYFSVHYSFMLHALFLWGIFLWVLMLRDANNQGKRLDFKSLFSRIKKFSTLCWS